MTCTTGAGGRAEQSCVVVSITGLLVYFIRVSITADLSNDTPTGLSGSSSDHHEHRSAHRSVGDVTSTC